MSHWVATVKVYDFLVIGAGISGTAAAAHLAGSGSVVLLEAETEAGYHSTGRSAALYTLNYGSALIRRITLLGYPFMNDPQSHLLPEADSIHQQNSFLSEIGMLSIAKPGEESLLDEILSASGAAGSVNEISSIDASEVLRLVPALRPELVSCAAYEPGVQRIDVDAAHQLMLRTLRHRGGECLLNARVNQLDRIDGLWHVQAAGQKLVAKTVVNAAGAWAEYVGQIAGAGQIGLQPKRRTVMMIDVEPGLNMQNVPATEFVNDTPYFKPQGGQLLVSLGEEQAVAAQDIRPEELDLATLVDWVERHTLCPVKRIASSWAGLRSFVADNNPVVGFDPLVPDFFWLAAQGGYGIMMAEPLARAAKELILNGQLPDDFIKASITEPELSPNRFG